MLGFTAWSAPITFTWDYDKPHEIDGFFLYAHTNGVVAAKDAKVIVNTGTNQVVSVDQFTPGRWTVWATAYTVGTNENGTNFYLESDPSKSLLIRVPAAPTNMATVAVQWVGTLASTNWTDMGFFRLKIGTP
jgi:hypothetical protein